MSESCEQPEVIVGSRTCAHVLYLSMVGQRPVVSDNIEDVLVARHRAGEPIDVNHAAISHLLHDGFVPPPLTVYRDVFGISVDLQARIDGTGISFDRDFPFENHKSPLNGHADTGLLLSRLAQATGAACTLGRDVVLMLSSGLDSTSVAVAAKEAGRDDVLCVTYGESENDVEIIVARDNCRRLGLRHEAHLFDPRDRRARTDLIAYASTVAQPCADPALTACVSLVRRFGTPGGVVLDGSGNDYYFWRPPRRLDMVKTWLGLGRLPMARKLRSMVPMHYRRERILATPLELLLLNGAWLRHSETRRFYPQVVDTHEYWRKECEDVQFSREEIQHCLKMIYMGPAAFMLKTRNAAQSIGAVARFPWTEDSVADYCFALPEAARFDRKRRKSKTLIRQMLRDAIAYDATAIGKHHFSFGKRDFLRSNLDFCRDEILNCTLWSGAIEGGFKKLAALLERGRQAENALLSLLVVSLWHNHWIRSNMCELLRAHRPTGLREIRGRADECEPSGFQKLAS